RPSAKLSDRYLGPFTVLDVVGTHRLAYKLKLPPTWKIHDVFHVSLLEPYHPRAGATLDIPEDPIDQDKEWEVESILDHKEFRNGRRYLVRWRGFSSTDDTWEPRS